MTALLHVRGQPEYAVTPDDILWLLRAVEAEGPPQDGVARALLSLHALHRAKGGAWSLAQLVRSYAQPVSPKWADVGTPAQRARRKAARERTEFGVHARAAVAAALTEPWPESWPRDITDYAAPSVDATSKGYVERATWTGQGNRLWTRQPGWDAYVVTEGGMPLPVRVRELARLLPDRERAQVRAALERLDAGAVGAVDAVAEAQTLEALYHAVAARVRELGAESMAAGRGAVASQSVALLALVLAVFWLLQSQGR